MHIEAIVNEKKYYFVVLLFILWTAIGAFPLICYEGDSQHIIAGMDLLCNNGFHLPPSYTYQYDMQPMVTVFIVAIKKVFPFLTCGQWYCLMSWIASWVFIISSIRLAEVITDVNKYAVLFAAFLLPEMYAIGMYANSAIFAAAIATTGFLCFATKKDIAGIILFCIAPTFRVDILLIYPVVFFILRWAGNDWEKAFVKSLVTALIVIVALVLFFYFLDANPFNSLGGLEIYKDNGAYASKVKFAVFSFYTLVNIILVPIGIYFFCKDKKWLPLVIALFPMIFWHAIFHDFGSATKHFAYLSPFVIMLTSIALAKGWVAISNKCLLKYSIIIALALFLTMSLRMDMNMKNKEWMNQPYSSAKMGPEINLVRLHKHNMTIGFGAGQLIPTSDEWMLCSGNLFYPFYIHTYKMRIKNILDSEHKYLTNVKGKHLYTFSWEGLFSFSDKYLNDGFGFKKDKNPITGGERFNYSKGSTQFDISYELGYQDKNKIQETINKLKGKKAYIITMHENEEMLLRQIASTGIVDRVAENMYIVK